MPTRPAPRPPAAAAAPDAVLTIVAISDTHMRHRDLPPLPRGDVLVHAGDIDAGSPEHSAEATPDLFLARLADFNAWLGELRAAFPLGILVTAGNHDRWLAQLPIAVVRAHLSNATFLVDEAVTVGGVSFFMSPVSFLRDGKPYNTAFQTAKALPRALCDDRSTFDVIVTHDSPCRWEQLRHALFIDGGAAAAVVRPRCRLHICGHHHDYYGAQFVTQRCSDRDERRGPPTARTPEALLPTVVAGDGEQKRVLVNDGLRGATAPAVMSVTACVSPDPCGVKQVGTADGQWRRVKTSGDVMRRDPFVVRLPVAR
jgi:hypothetical protein